MSKTSWSVDQGSSFDLRKNKNVVELVLRELTAESPLKCVSEKFERYGSYKDVTEVSHFFCSFYGGCLYLFPSFSYPNWIRQFFLAAPRPRVNWALEDHRFDLSVC